MVMFPGNLGHYYGAQPMQGAGANLPPDPRAFLPPGVPQHHPMFGVAAATPSVPPPPYTAQHAEAYQRRQREEAQRAKAIEDEQKRRQLEATRQRLRQVGRPGSRPQAGVSVDALIRNIVGPSAPSRSAVPATAAPAPAAAAAAVGGGAADVFSDFQSASPAPPPAPAAMTTPAVQPQQQQPAKPDLNSFMMACSDLSAPSKAKTFKKRTVASAAHSAHATSHVTPVAVESKKATKWDVMSENLDGLFVLPSVQPQPLPNVTHSHQEQQPVLNHQQQQQQLPPAYQQHPSALSQQQQQPPAYQQHPSALSQQQQPPPAYQQHPSALSQQQQQPAAYQQHPSALSQKQQQQQPAAYQQHPSALSQQQQPHTQPVLNHQQQQQQPPAYQQQQPAARAEAGAVPEPLPAWTSRHESLPLVYQQLYQAAVRDEGRLDTGFLHQVFLTSGLPVAVLGHIWAQVNRTRPGELVREELNAALALIALAQRSPGELPMLRLLDLAPPPEPLFCLAAPTNGAAPAEERPPEPVAPREPPEPARDEFGGFQAADDKYAALRTVDPPAEAADGREEGGEWNAFAEAAPAPAALAAPLAPATPATPASAPAPAAPAAPAADEWGAFSGPGAASGPGAWANFSTVFSAQLEVIDLTNGVANGAIPAPPAADQRRPVRPGPKAAHTQPVGVRIAEDIELPPSEEKHEFVDAFAREDFGAVLSSSSASTSEDYADLSSQASYEQTSTSSPSSVDGTSPRHQPRSVPAVAAVRPPPARRPPVPAPAATELGRHAWRDEPPPLDCVEEDDDFGDFQSSAGLDGVAEGLRIPAPAPAPAVAAPARPSPAPLPSLVPMAPPAFALDAASLGRASSVRSLDLPPAAGLAESNAASLRSLDLQPPGLAPDEASNTSVKSLDLQAAGPAPDAASTSSVKSLDLQPPALGPDEASNASVKSLDLQHPGPPPDEASSSSVKSLDLQSPGQDEPEQGGAIRVMAEAPSVLLSSSSDRYCSLAGDLVDAGDLQVSQWQRCLAAARDRMDASCGVLDRAKAEQVLAEVLTARQTRAHLEALVEIYLVTRRIAAACHVFSFVKQKVDDDLSQIDALWTRVVEFLRSATIQPPDTDLALFKARDSGRPSCGVCLNELDGGATHALEFGGRAYHCGCANMWVNCVDAMLPSFSPPRLL